MIMNTVKDLYRVKKECSSEFYILDCIWINVLSRSLGTMFFIEIVYFHWWNGHGNWFLKTKLYLKLPNLMFDRQKSIKVVLSEVFQKLVFLIFFCENMSTLSVCLNNWLKVFHLLTRILFYIGTHFISSNTVIMIIHETSF